MRARVFGCVAAAVASLISTGARAQVVTFESLLDEMNDRMLLSQLPQPAYTCRQFSSYDRQSTKPGEESWFANADAGQFIRTEQHSGRTEYVMMDAHGPGAVVRVWSANPKGTLRVYVDGDDDPVIEGEMAELLNTGGLAPAPLAEICSTGYDLYLPIPYAKRCVITSDEGGFYYQINVRFYEPGTVVKSYQRGMAESEAGAVREAANGLRSQMWTSGRVRLDEARIAPGETFEHQLPDGEHAIAFLSLHIDDPGDWERVLRPLVLEIEFDGERTVWAPVGDFFGSGIGLNELTDRMRQVGESGNLSCGWIMPYEKSATVRLHNLGSEPVSCSLGTRTREVHWTDRSMHFHATWREQREIPTRPMRDWNFVTIEGEGVYVGDLLTVTNPEKQWWGEGDEKIYVDGEIFPSHFGTGTEDYYGYAWCCPRPFQSPLHAQVRCDGEAYNNNYGTTTVTRLRSLDAIPFQKSLRFDMEVWHWSDTRISQSAVTYFYARPGAVVNVEPDPQQAAMAPPAAPPLPPPLDIEDAIEAEDLQVTSSSQGLEYGPQQGAAALWNRGQQLWVRAKSPGDFIELKLPAEGGEPQHLYVRLTRSWDYGVVAIKVNGEQVEKLDLFNTDGHEVGVTGRIDLGIHRPSNGGFKIRFEVTGSNERSEGSGSFFGIDCFELEPNG